LLSVIQWATWDVVSPLGQASEKAKIKLTRTIINKVIINMTTKINNSCKEIAIFKVSKENFDRVMALSVSIFAEMNADEVVITQHEIFQNVDKDDEICWYLTWKSIAAAKKTTQKWPSFPSTKELELLVGDNLYYGHFAKIKSA